MGAFFASSLGGGGGSVGFLLCKKPIFAHLRICMQTKQRTKRKRREKMPPTAYAFKRLLYKRKFCVPCAAALRRYFMVAVYKILLVII